MLSGHRKQSAAAAATVKGEKVRVRVFLWESEWDWKLETGIKFQVPSLSLLLLLPP